jgi:hypothetical protein
MTKVIVGSFLGLVLGVACVAVLLPLSIWVVRRIDDPVMRVDQWVYYLCIVVGAAAGAVCGALSSATAAVIRALRDRPSPRS